MKMRKLLALLLGLCLYLSLLPAEMVSARADGGIPCGGERYAVNGIQ